MFCFDKSVDHSEEGQNTQRQRTVWCVVLGVEVKKTLRSDQLSLIFHASITTFHLCVTVQPEPWLFTSWICAWDISQKISCFTGEEKANLAVMAHLGQSAITHTWMNHSHVLLCAFVRTVFVRSRVVVKSNTSLLYSLKRAFDFAI